MKSCAKWILKLVVLYTHTFSETNPGPSGVRACVRYAYRGGARGVPGPSVVRWTRSRAWEARTGIDKHNGLVKFHSTILLFACARVGPTGSNMLRCGILAPTARSVRKTKTVEWNLSCPLVWVTFLRFETAIAGILGPPLHPSSKIAHDSRNSYYLKSRLPSDPKKIEVTSQ